MILNSRHVDPLAPLVNLREDLHPYLHGSGFGMGTEVLADPSSAEVLKKIEPNRFMECNGILDKYERVLNGSCAKQITLCMENSCVVAALAQLRIGLIPLELDVWIDKKEPGSLEKAVIGHGSVFAILFGKLPFMRNFFLKTAPSVTKWINGYKTAASCFNALSNRKIEGMPSVCLDVKSVWSTANDIDCFVRALKRKFQINVRFVGSFSHRQIAQVTESETILFFHGLWDLQRSVELGCFPKMLMLNGADLEEGARLEILREIVDKYQVEIGIYVQESEADTKTVQCLIEMVNSEPELFKLGFALGNGRDGRSARMIKGSGAGAQQILLTNSILPKMYRMITRIGSIARSFFSLNYWVRSRRYHSL